MGRLALDSTKQLGKKVALMGLKAVGTGLAVLTATDSIAHVILYN